MILKRVNHRRGPLCGPSAPRAPAQPSSGAKAVQADTDDQAVLSYVWNHRHRTAGHPRRTPQKGPRQHGLEDDAATGRQQQEPCLS
jgi:hypothetical protein